MGPIQRVSLGGGVASDEVLANAAKLMDDYSAARENADAHRDECMQSVSEVDEGAEDDIETTPET